ncbi:RNA-directed DNA polymerase, eukaryota, reverse transcriptase zinc-binding domain protein [Tanacetum coccineum]
MVRNTSTIQDTNGWFWKEVEKIASSFYITNFPDYVDAKRLWKECEPYGRIVDAFIANKRSKVGKRFCFVHFLGVKNDEQLARSLTSIWIRSYHLFASMARFNRHEKKDMLPQKVVEKTNNSLPTQKVEKHEIKRKRITLSDEELVQVTYPQDVDIVKVTIHGEDYEAYVQELGSWSINLDDTSSQQSETNSKMDIKFDNDKDANSVSESDDENDIQEALNVSQEANEVRKAQEECIHGNNVNISCEEVVPETQMDRMVNSSSSDLSRPPGFKHYKFFENEYSSSSLQSKSGKCPTHFEKLKRNGIRGISVIHEMSRLIEVGKKLRYDVKGCHNSLQKLIDRIGVLMKTIKEWNHQARSTDMSRKLEIVRKLTDIEEKIDSNSALDTEKEDRVKLLKERDDLQHLEDMDLMQKAKVIWDVEGDENTKFFHDLLKQKRSQQAVQVSWKFLDHMLSSLGFGNKWRRWINIFLHSTRASVLVNGSQTSEFSIKRGLRQGNPLSPFLFIIVMEGLHIALKNAVSSGLIQGASIGESCYKISHLFYVDDVVIISDWNRQDMINIIHVLHVFYLASGLKINVSKSNIYGFGMNPQDIKDMARVTLCGSCTVPFSYLGLPLGANINLISNWQPLVDRFWARLSSWKANTLSIGGRLTLIKSVLGSLRIYYLSIFKCPELVLNSLEAMRTSFFWGAINLALLQKWRWHLVTNPDSIWAQVIVAIHGAEAGADLKGCYCNGVWASIISRYSMLHNCNLILKNTLSRKVGNGLSICFWKDAWNGGGTLMSRFHKEAALGFPCVDWVRFSSLMGPDSCRWSFDVDGIFFFSCNESAYDSCCSPSCSPCTSWSKILPRKVNIFAWHLSLDRLPTQLNLSLRGLDISSIIFPMCNDVVEAVDHVFFGCDLACDVWRLARRWTNLDMPSFSSWFDCF